MPTDHKPEIMNNGQAAPARPRGKRNWVWFFVVLVSLTVAAIALLWIYNLGQQLTPEDLAVARQLWQEKRPSNYVLSYTKEGSASGSFVVTVKNGLVKSALMNQEVTENGRVRTVSNPLGRRLYNSYDMTGLFQDLQRFLEMRKEPGGGRVFLTAKFDPNDGHVTGFIFSNSATGQRVKVVVKLERLPGQTR